ncbi:MULTISPECIES: nickel pincer cofactor biosynthesis protein LarB [unclassified Chelatococcus]|uniref:nickel pincer cofactor biosynthesis protein LarB n=1 Tax=unclassified Chelatococcus TaxID=2638111 RepID=UPI001BCE719F|nr:MULTISPECIES: nickel pincer cofactor biosynthesis protein LarB [unclassified Chelatococcus]CAH1648080.1 Pyridinium-3,5-biscarboxylic acid mononucleotide synthase [Hyphomicrobiales bacterium]MBS7742075.1 nickel pincer cofactor biosynthesis protein LarB [Chelatococcus sp. HY11]MBX3541127.1 nickel pincer cofactor biosynthesis protein LarB [Chelatococcus sp.]MCO5074978.1 nickel pincer cofactor biosynthesis protein LarB [Chelatococcus sp.]CAH1690317.1 Pyridinium-3,5-biscarboxylic acid mononucleo
MADFIMDWERETRTGVPEAVFCAGKTVDDIAAIITAARVQDRPLLLTRLTPEMWASLPEASRAGLDYDARSRTACLGRRDAGSRSSRSVVIVAAGTSDLSVALEAQRTLWFHGIDAPLVADVGVAGLWRLMARIEDIRRHDVVIAVAGMEGALFSVLAGLVKAPVIAVPTSVGYGVAAGGQAALSTALASCSPGIATVNIDGGFSAAVLAKKMIYIGMTDT